MNMSHALYPSPLGNLYISAADNYITNVSFHDTGKPISPSSLTQKCCTQLDEYFNGERKVFELELLQKGTEFQQKVWTKLMDIPFGKTSSYQQLSVITGNVKAIRAVGNANSKNNIVIMVPCHRVIGSNGNLIGYAGELWRKKWLLEHEAKWEHGVQKLFETTCEVPTCEVGTCEVDGLA